MDRRHGKRPLPSEASEEKEKEQVDHFPSATAAYESSWSETELSAMVSALTQVIGTGDDNNPAASMVQSNPSLLLSTVKQEPDPSQPVQPTQGAYCYSFSNFGFTSDLLF